LYNEFAHPTIPVIKINHHSPLPREKWEVVWFTKRRYPVDAQPDATIEATYNEYIGEATRIQKENQRAFSLYRLAMLIGLIPMLLALFGKMPPGWFWYGVILALIIYVISLVVANTHEKNSLARAVQSRPGFVEFYRLQFRGAKYYKIPNQDRYWPTPLPEGEKTDKFLSILGRKDSQ
jgi:hypothetical protein